MLRLELPEIATRIGVMSIARHFLPVSVIDLPEIGCQLALAELFEQVGFPPANADDEPI